jgi:hypothetical protein
VSSVVTDTQVPLGRRVGARHAVIILVYFLDVTTSFTGLNNRLTVAAVIVAALLGHEHTIDLLLQNCTDHLYILPESLINMIVLKPAFLTRVRREAA